jgi:hypothetical protein
MKPTCPERLSSPSVTPVFRELPAAELPQLRDRTPGEFDLPARALWSLDPRPDIAVHCLSGQLWITQAGDGRDIILLAGESFTPAAKGRVVVQALSDARVVVRDGHGVRVSDRRSA